MLAPVPVRRKKLGDHVFDQLLVWIESGVLKPGDHLPSERELMKQFDVGRPAVREALQQLHGKGLVVISHGERSKVAKLDAQIAIDQIDDVAKLLLSQEPMNLDRLRQLRWIFEIGMVEIAAGLCTPGDVQDLERLLDEQRKHIGDVEAFIQCDIGFHVRVAEICANPLLKVVSEAVLRWLFGYHSDLVYCSDNEEITLLEHQQIVTCLANNDAHAASAIMRKHLERLVPPLAS